jgi:Peptidase_C39 like family
MEKFKDYSDHSILGILNDIRELNDIPLEVPVSFDTFPDKNIEVIRYGYVEEFKLLNHKQGNVDGFQGTCGIVSCENILKKFNIDDISEESLVNFSKENKLCQISNESSISGATTVFNQRDILNLHDIPAHVELHNNYEILAGYVEQGKGIIIEVNAGVLWDDASAYEYGQANHAIVVTGYGRNKETGMIEGFYINDSGRGYATDSGRFISTDILDDAFLEAGGLSVITDIIY